MDPKQINTEKCKNYFYIKFSIKTKGGRKVNFENSECYFFYSPLYIYIYIYKRNFCSSFNVIEMDDLKKKLKLKIEKWNYQTTSLMWWKMRWKKIMGVVKDNKLIFIKFILEVLNPSYLTLNFYNQKNNS